MSFDLNSVSKFTNFNNVQVTKDGHEEKLPETKQKKFLFLKWDMKLVPAINRKTNHLELVYFSRFDRFVQTLLPSTFLKHDSNEKRVWKFLQTNQTVNENEGLPPKDERRLVLADKISLLVQEQQRAKTDKEGNAPEPAIKKKKNGDDKPQPGITRKPDSARDKTPVEVGNKKNIDQFVSLMDQQIESDESIKVLHTFTDLNAPLPALKHTPLTLALEKGNLPAVKFLLKEGANPNQANVLGDSPLAVAVKMDRSKQYIQPLIEAGAKPKNESEYKELRKLANDWGKEFLVKYLDDTQKA